MVRNIRSSLHKKLIIKGLVPMLIFAVAFTVGTYNVNAIEAQKASMDLQRNSSTRVGDWVFTVNNISESTYNHYKTALKGNKFLCVNLKVENKGTKEQQMTSSMMFKLTDSNKHQYNVVLPEGLDSLNGILAPNAIMKGNIWFEVPQEEKQFQLIIYPSILNSNSDILNIDFTGSTNAVTSKAVQIDNLVFTLKSISTADMNTFKGTDIGYRLLNIELSVKNNGTKEEQITSNMAFKLTDEEGQVYSIVLPEERGINGLLKAKAELNGKITFKVKTENKGLKLEIKPWATKSVKAFIDIKI